MWAQGDRAWPWERLRDWLGARLAGDDVFRTRYANPSLGAGIRLGIVVMVFGSVIAFFVITVAAAEVAVGLAIVIDLARRKTSVDVDDASDLRG